MSSEAMVECERGHSVTLDDDGIRDTLVATAEAHGRLITEHAVEIAIKVARDSESASGKLAVLNIVSSCFGIEPGKYPLLKMAEYSEAMKQKYPRLRAKD